ncbi:Sideroflexin-4 [Myotis brandtii]|uniref:Sideroflexin-4 n=1 Tax=Myotis brandtii TaxID=109478 RepID=S7NFN3_MYOBR|nr:Sideroflexin-4 [Myotis brandtii]
MVVSVVSFTETVAVGEERGDGSPGGASCWSSWEVPLGRTPGTILTETQWSKIEKSRQLLLTNEDGSIHDLQDKRIQEAWKRSLATVHPDSSKLIPSLFRPAEGFLTVSLETTA